MNARTQNLDEISTKAINKSCYKCGYVRKTSDEKCGDCGKVLESVSRIKITGAIQIILGGCLLAFMGWLAFRMLNANSNNHFRGGANDVLFIVFVFALVASINLGVLVAGAWQIVFGKRNKYLMLAMIILGIAFVAAGFGVFLNK